MQFQSTIVSQKNSENMSDKDFLLIAIMSTVIDFKLNFRYFQLQVAIEANTRN